MRSIKLYGSIVILSTPARFVEIGAYKGRSSC
ncbi:hypothetical protein SAMN05444169_3200 [Bradyrhizobium erythrophlei]|uniref:Uncharacterized protein n=1 Tax=Bradyrhizobium erythrophlei TaxID=1437360 RepID=A0A1M5L1C3_9BRAD|nr:hypothetical protein SAMN05444169_3200 [Bradyrhizobium erythrophlei]